METGSVDTNVKIRIFLLAGGKGERLYPYTDIMDKSLLPVYNKPAIRHIVDNILNSNIIIDKIVVCCLKKFEPLFKHEFRDCPKVITYAAEEPLGTLGHILQCYNDGLITDNDIILIHYADCMIKADYDKLIILAKDKGTTILVSNNVNSEYSRVKFRMNKIVGFKEKGKIPYYTWTGVMSMRGKDLREFSNNMPEKPDFAIDLFPRLVKEGRLYYIMTDKSWIDIGNIRSYRIACQLAEEGKLFL